MLDKLRGPVLPLPSPLPKSLVWEVTEDSQDSKTPSDVGKASSLLGYGLGMEWLRLVWFF